MTAFSTDPVLYRAPFVVPVTSAPIGDGGVLVQYGRITAVDSFSRLRQQASQVVEMENAILTPALINCHAHLELSYLTDLATSEVDNSTVTSNTPADFTDWIRALLIKRGQPVPRDTIIKSSRKALAEHYQRGVALVADVGNLGVGREIGVGSMAELLVFRELLGVSEETAMAVAASLVDGEPCTAHAPYSCHPVLIKALKERSRRSGTLFPIHLAESDAEVNFLRTGSGPFHDFLLERLRQTASLADGQALEALLPHPGCGGVEYLHSLGVLDAQTICVHAVHVSAAEIDLLATKKAKVCLCPASNRKLKVGIAPVLKLLACQIMPGLGTDSLASNDCLDLWHEMKVLQEDHPDVDPEQIFTMATLGGASTLAVDSRLGALAPGREARMLAVPFSGKHSDIFPFLVNNGTAQKVTWVEGS